MAEVAIARRMLTLCYGVDVEASVGGD